MVIQVIAIQSAYFGYLSVILGIAAIASYLLNGWLFFSVGQHTGVVGEPSQEQLEKPDGKRMKYYPITGLLSLLVIFLLMLALTEALPGQVFFSP